MPIKKRPSRAAKTAPRRKRTKLKLPTLTAFKRLSLMERTKVFARWAKTQRGRYDYWNEHACPLARFGKAIIKCPVIGGGHSFMFGDHDWINVEPENAFAVCDSGIYPEKMRGFTYEALVKRLKAHIAAQT